MKKLIFNCKLLTDVIVSSSTATEGMHESLDYIPGSKFLGILAKPNNHYKETDIRTLDLFHNGKVRFGDGHIVINNKRSNKIPFSWYIAKDGKLENEVYLHHKVIDSDLDIQLKQARTGYFSSDQYLKTDQNFEQKSAYNSETRRSKDKQMFGYYALPKDSEYQFYVECETDEFIETIKNGLTGKHRIGRSRSAEYGLVEISFIESIEITNGNEAVENNCIIYAESNLCFYNQHLQTTGIPTVKQLLCPPDSKIIWQKSQIRTRMYQTWNRKRCNRNSDRLIIEKGSAFFIELSKPTIIETWINGIGAFKNEGFGKVIINPNFLDSEGLTLSYPFSKYINEKKEIAFDYVLNREDENVITFLCSKSEEANALNNLNFFVNNFVSEYGVVFNGITNSQWGQIRNYAKHCQDACNLRTLLFNESCGYLYKGKSKLAWSKKDRRGILEKVIFINTHGFDKPELTIKLAAEMAKKSKK